MNKFFFELLQIAIGNRKELTRQLTDDEWASVYGICEKQALLGIAFAGVEKLPKEQYPPFDVLAEWVHDAQVAKDRNKLLNRKCKEVCEIFDRDGFYSCILKGQSNLANYPENIRFYRTAGDIDVLCWPKVIRKGFSSVIEYVHSLNEKVSGGRQRVRFHHVDWEYANISVEVHFRASYLNCPWHNRRFQNWVADTIIPEKGDSGFPVPSVSFNVIYQLIHIYRHLFSEGIGLRQLLDYYFVLRKVRDDRLEDRDEKFEIMRVVESFGMKRFTSAIMYVLQTVFAMPNQFLICPPNEKYGKFLLNEIMQSGNFGHYDKRNEKFRQSSKIVRFFYLTKRNWRFFMQYPTEVIFDPFRRFVAWGMNYGWK